MSVPPLDRLIPHRPPMRLIEEVLGESAEGFVCRGRIPAELSTDGAASPLLGLEMGAQAAAVLAALGREGVAGGEPGLGYLVSIREARFECPELPAERLLTVRVRATGGVLPLTTYEIRIAMDETSAPLLSATIGTFVLE